ncbi:MAG: peptidyl-prolyl cis-trans isomerase [Gammaproteobacteria bacterium]|nr:peptidyl-prolyl cis-trans isomerase [Gammaproteobacteria bacterium]
MKRKSSLLGAALLGFAALALAAPSGSHAASSGAPEVRIVTTQGDIVVQLDPDKAPITVRNFLEYVKSGFYEGTIFHRVVPGFVIQGGGYTVGNQAKETRRPIPLEAANGLKNRRGTIAMARTSDPNSATSQFYINLADNESLDAGPTSLGYAVFGHVVSGMKVVDKIASVETASSGPFRHAPVVPVVIKNVVLIKANSASQAESGSH